MEPFRDDLAAAHEKIARLEEEMRELRHENDPPPPVLAIPPTPEVIDPEHQRQTRIMTFLLVGFIVLFFAVFGGLVFAISRAEPPPVKAPTPVQPDTTR